MWNDATNFIIFDLKFDTSFRRKTTDTWKGVKHFFSALRYGERETSRTC